MGFFTKRGQLRDNEKINLKLNQKSRRNADDDSAQASEEEEEDPVDKRNRLKRELDHKLVRKENLVPKTGKGRFNVTVPVPFEFMN